MAAPPYILTSNGDVAMNDLPNTTAISFGDAPVAGINMTDIGTAGRVLSAGTNPGTAGGDYIVAVFALPAGTFGQAGRGLVFEAGGGFANNTNAKRCKLIWQPTVTPVVGALVSGGTTIADTGTYSTAGAVFLRQFGNRYYADGAYFRHAIEVMEDRNIPIPETVAKRAKRLR